MKTSIGRSHFSRQSNKAGVNIAREASNYLRDSVQLMRSNSPAFLSTINAKIYPDDEESYPIKTSIIPKNGATSLFSEELYSIIKQHVSDFDPKSKVLKYLDEQTGNTFIVKKRTKIDLDTLKAGNISLFISHKLISNTHKSKKRREIPLSRTPDHRVSKKVENLEMLVNKIKVLLSGMIKCINNLPPNLFTILGEIYSDAEMETLKMRDFYEKQKSQNEFEDMSITLEEKSNLPSQEREILLHMNTVPDTSIGVKHSSIRVSPIENELIETEGDRTKDKEQTVSKIKKKFSLNFKKKQTIKQMPSLTKELALLHDPEYMKISKLDSTPLSEQIHFGIVYSNPLLDIKENDMNYCYISDPVDFNNECLNILECFQEKKKRINVYIQCAQTGELTKLIVKRPKILHIICHGDYDAERGEYFLEFENNRLELFRLSTSKLREMLEGMDLSDIKLVFVNACHSEEVARVFFDFGVKCIIVVQGKNKINDLYASVFSRYLFDYLLEKQSIKQAFTNAISMLKSFKDKSSSACCCGHSHKESCIWIKEIRGGDSTETAHYKHEPNCNCKDSHKNVHSKRCDWAQKFMQKYQPNVDIYESKDTITVCCCSPELEHDEVMKFRLLFKNNEETCGNYKIFEDRLDKGNIIQLNNAYFGGTHFNDCSLIGYNMVLYTIYNSFVNEKIKIIYLNGEPGLGKTTMAKIASNLLEERNKVTSVDLVDIEHIETTTAFKAKLSAVTYFLDDEEDESDYRKKLLIFDKADNILENAGPEFRKYLLDYSKGSSFIFMIVSCKMKLFKDLVPTAQEKCVKVGGIDKRNAAKLLLNMAKDELPLNLRSILNLEKHSIFKSIQNKSRKIKYTDILNIGLRLKAMQSLDDIMISNKAESDEVGSNGVNLNKSRNVATGAYDIRRNFIRRLRKEDPVGSNLYFLLAMFKKGVLLSDIRVMVQLNMVPSNWIFCLWKIIASENNVNMHFVLEAKEIIEKLIFQSEKNEEGDNSDYLTLSGILNNYNAEDSSNHSWISLSRIKLHKRNEILIAVEPLMIEIISEELEKETSKFPVQISNYLLYYISFFTSIIKKNIDSKLYSEDIIENTVCNSGSFWKVKSTEVDSDHHYFTSKKIPFDEVLELLNFHQSNIDSFIRGSTTICLLKVYSILVGLNEEDCDHGKMIIEDLVMSYLTISKIKGDHSKAFEDAMYISRKITNEVSRKRTDPIRRFRSKLELFQIDMLYQGIKKSTDSTKMQEIQEQFNYTERQLDDLEIRSYYFLMSEFLVSKYYIQAEKWRNNSDQFVTNLFYKAFEDVKKFIDIILQQEEIKKPDYEFQLAKLRLVVLDFHYDSKEVEKSDIQLYLSCKEVFSKNDSTMLMIHCYHRLARLHIGKAEKCLEYSSLGKDLCKMIANNQYMLIFDEMILNSNKEISRKYSNKFLFYNSYSLMNKKSEEIEIYRNMIAIRELVIGGISDINKQVYINFENLTLACLEDIVSYKERGKMLVLDIHHEDESGLFLEDGLHKIEVNLNHILNEEEKNRPRIYTDSNFDVVFVVNGPYKILRTFLEKMRIPAIIYFNFEGKSNCYGDLLNSYLITEFQYTFLKNFTKKFANGYRLDEAISGAEVDSIEEISYKLSNNFKYFELMIEDDKPRTRPLPFPDLEEFFKDCVVRQISTFKPIICDLEPGSVMEANPNNIKSQNHNFELFQKSIIHRGSDVIDMYSAFQLSPFVNLVGTRGNGKSILALQMANELLKRGMYTGGIYYFELKDLVKAGNHNLKDLMRIHLGEHFDQNTHNFFSGKEMMLIFDDFDEVIKRKTVQYPSFLLRTLLELNVHCLFITTEKIPMINEFKNLFHFRLNQLDKLKTALISMSIYGKTFISGDLQRVRRVLASQSGSETGNFREIVMETQHFINKLTESCVDDLHRSAAQVQSQLEMAGGFQRKATSYFKELGDGSEAKKPNHRKLWKKIILFYQINKILKDCGKKEKDPSKEKVNSLLNVLGKKMKADYDKDILLKRMNSLDKRMNEDNIIEYLGDIDN